MVDLPQQLHWESRARARPPGLPARKSAPGLEPVDSVRVALCRTLGGASVQAPAPNNQKVLTMRNGPARCCHGWRREHRWILELVGKQPCATSWLSAALLMVAGGQKWSGATLSWFTKRLSAHPRPAALSQQPGAAGGGGALWVAELIRPPAARFWPDFASSLLPRSHVECIAVAALVELRVAASLWRGVRWAAARPCACLRLETGSPTWGSAHDEQL